MSLAINALGLNLQARCNIMHLFDLAPTKSIMDQAIGRLWRYGQQMVVVVIRLFGECWLDHSTASKACDDFLGLNLHPRCNIINFFDMPPNKFIVPQSTLPRGKRLRAPRPHSPSIYTHQYGFDHGRSGANVIMALYGVVVVILRARRRLSRSFVYSLTNRSLKNHPPINCLPMSWAMTMETRIRMNLRISGFNWGP